MTDRNNLRNKLYAEKTVKTALYTNNKRAHRRVHSDNNEYMYCCNRSSLRYVFLLVANHANSELIFKRQGLIWTGLSVSRDPKVTIKGICHK